VARYGQAYKDRIVATCCYRRVLRWSRYHARAAALAKGSGAGSPHWTAAARLQAVIVTAAMDEATRSGWCREQGLYPAELARIIRSLPWSLLGHESRSTCGCAAMSWCGHLSVSVVKGSGNGWRLTERATGGATAPQFRRSGAANDPAAVRRLPDPVCWSAGAA
jgi:hypothetical protein